MQIYLQRELSKNHYNYYLVMIQFVIFNFIIIIMAIIL